MFNIRFIPFLIGVLILVQFFNIAKAKAHNSSELNNLSIENLHPFEKSKRNSKHFQRYKKSRNCTKNYNRGRAGHRKRHRFTRVTASRKKRSLAGCRR